MNVIVIMNESLSDLSVLPGVESNTDAMPFLRSLTENTIKGYAYSSVFGGTTANSEYEFLTGNTTAFLPAGTVPYQMYVSDGDPTLVGQMAALGYRTVAAHPYRSSGWSRPSVYQDFGFDEVYFEGDFQDREYMRGDEKTGYVTDQCDYENLIRWYEEKEAGEPLFLFNVTMQNHSAYQMAWTDLPREVWLTGALEGRFNTVNQYLSLVYQSDQAFEYLLDYFSQVEEPTLILLFGDHQPQVATNFYTDVLGTAPDTALAQKKQMVPFVLWANYDIPEAQGVELSLNYLSALLMDTANLPMTGYQKYLARLWEAAPVINTVGIRDAGGNWYGENEALPEELDAALEKPLDRVIHPFNPKETAYSSGSTDVGDVGYATPTVMFHVATACLGNVGHSWQNTAFACSDIGMKGMLRAAEIMTLAAIRTMDQPAVIAKAREELKQKNGGGSYHCPLPDYVTPPIGRY